MNRNLVACCLLLTPGFALGQIATPKPVELRDGGTTLIRTGMSLRLPYPVSAVHVIRDELLLVQEGGRYRFIVEGSPSSANIALLRTLPRQSSQGKFIRMTPEGYLLFESDALREEIEISALLGGTFVGTARPRDAGATKVFEPVMTPVTKLFWRPQRPTGYVGPGHGSRQDVIAAFARSRPSERIEEYEPFDCGFLPHVTQKNRLNVWVPTRTQVFEHTLRDRQGHTQIFFTALESRDVTYATEPEATAGGCMASFERTRHNGPLSLPPDQPLSGKDQYRVRVELRDLGLPAGGVLVRIRELRDAAGQACGNQASGKTPDLTPDDGMTLADGTYVWKRELFDQHRFTTARRRHFDFTDNTLDVTLCVRLDGMWQPLWFSSREHGAWGVRCDLALPKARRCRRIV